MLDLVTWDEAAPGGDDPPPRDRLATGREQGADGPRRPRVAGLLGDLAVGDDLAGPEPAQHGPHVTLERRHGGRGYAPRFVGQLGMGDAGRTMSKAEYRARVDALLGVIVTAVRWAARAVGALAVAVVVAGLVDAALVAAFAPVAASLAVAGVAIVAAVLLVLYRRRLRSVVAEEEGLRVALTGEWLDGEVGRHLNEDLMPRLRRGSPVRRLRALWEVVSIVREHSAARRVREALDAVAGGAGLVPYAALLAVALVVAAPVLAVVAVVA